MDELAEMRKLKIEETALIKMLDVLKKQLNRLKVEELILASKIRENSVPSSASSSPSKPSTSNVTFLQAINKPPEDINKVNLNLFTGSGLNQTYSQPDDEDEEMESEDEDNNPLESFLDF